MILTDPHVDCAPTDSGEIVPQSGDFLARLEVVRVVRPVVRISKRRLVQAIRCTARFYDSATTSGIIQDYWHGKRQTVAIFMNADMSICKPIRKVQR